MLCAVGNLTLPTPVVLAGAGMCLLAGALVGYVAAPDSGGDASVATVASYDPPTSRLCLTGDAVKDQPGLDAEGELCGTWRRSGIVRQPKAGEKFRFVVVRTEGRSGGQERHQVLLYGDVVR